MMNRYVISAMTVALMSSAAVNAAAQDPWEVRRGTMVNITTCVVPAMEKDTFVLANIADSPAHPPIVGKVVYWVNEIDALRPYVGKRVQFDAMIKDVDRGEMESKASGVVEIEGSGKDVKAPPSLVGVSSAREPEERDIKTTVVELNKLTNFRVVGEGCPAAGAAATETAAMRTTETHTAEVHTPPAPVSTVTEVAETAVRTPERVAEAIVEAPPAPIPPPAPTPRPAPVMEMEARTTLPRTASPLPLMALFGVGSLIAGGALRLRRRG